MNINSKTNEHKNIHFKENEHKNIHFKENDDKKKLYALFFNIKDLKDVENVKKLLLKYGLNLHQMNGMYFSLFKSSKSPENKIINLFKIIYLKTNVKNFFFHTVSLEKTSSIYSLFNDINKIFMLEKGIVITDSVYDKILIKKSFLSFRNINSKETLIKLFSLDIKG
jgi:DNA polymerase III delta prime subunit